MAFPASGGEYSISSQGYWAVTDIAHINMDKNTDIKKIIDDFFSNASPEEIMELQSLLEERKKKPNTGMNIQNMAGKMASDLHEQMGITSDKIFMMSRDFVRNMILQHDPHISEENLSMLLEQWVPDRAGKWKKVPRDFLITMISQFVKYGRGEMSEEERKEFPEGWVEKYWSFFPEEIQKLIRAYLKDIIGKTDFWNSIESFLK